MSTPLKVNDQQRISFERPQLGEKPLKYYVTSRPMAKPTSHTDVGVLRPLYAKPKPNPTPTSLNELPATFELPVAHGYLALSIDQFNGFSIWSSGNLHFTKCG